MDVNILSALGIGAIIGSVITGLIAWAREHSKIERQFQLDIIKNRLKVITKLSTDYLLIASALAEFYRYVDEKDDELKFYLICKFFYYYTKITEEEGGFEFDNRPSEDAVAELVTEFFDQFEGLGYEVFSDMADQVSKNGKILHYNEFKKNISQTLFQKFLKIIYDTRKVSNLKKYAIWMAQIILFETNSVYSLWYNEHPRFPFDETLIKYLTDKNFKSYAERLTVSRKSKLSKIFYIKGNYF